MASSKTPLVDEAVQTELDYGAAAAAENLKNKHKLQGPLETAVAPTVSSKGVDGRTTTVRMTPKMRLFNMSEPPGGWNGPFGFLRLVAMAFLFLSGIMILTFVYAAVTNENAQSLACCLLLSGAALLAAGAAYSHEGLAERVAERAKRNNEYSAKIDSFARQANDLQSASDRITELLDGKAVSLEQFKQQMAKLDQLSSLNRISTISRAFIDAQLNNQLFNRSGDGDIDGLLSHSEVVHFLQSTQKTLQDRLSNHILDDLGRAAFFPGMSLTDVNLLLAAVNTDNEGTKECFMALLYFFLNPHQTELQEVMRRLRTHLKADPVFGSEERLNAYISKLLATAPKEGQWLDFGGERRHVPSRVPPAETKELAGIALHTFLKDDDEDLGLSDEL